MTREIPQEARAMTREEQIRDAALAKLDEDMDNDPEMQAMEREGTTPAPAGLIYVCGACGKTSPTRYGFDAQEKSVSSDGWDESCMLNAVLCSATKVDGKWQAAPFGSVAR